MSETTNRPERIVRLGVVGGGPGSNIGATHRYAARLDDRYALVTGHPEGFLEAFANIYSDIADAIGTRRSGDATNQSAYLFPTIEDGVLGVKFVDAAVASHQQEGRWVHASIDV
jgi:hypothetical protein